MSIIISGTIGGGKSKDDRRYRAISEREAKALVAVSPPDLALTWRMFILTGLRASELANLVWADVDLRARASRIRQTKNHEPRTVRLYQKLAADLDAWRMARCKAGESLDASNPVFVNSKRTRWRDTQTIRRRLLAWARKAKMSLDRFTTHSLRHTYGTLGLHKNLSLGEVKDTLGHKSLQMVAHYLHEDVDPDGTKTMEEFDEALHLLTPPQDAETIRKLTRAVIEKRSSAPDRNPGDTHSTEAIELQSGCTNVEKEAQPHA